MGICCRFKEVFYDEACLAIVMEYASQGHLSSLVKRQGKLSETDARRYHIASTEFAMPLLFQFFSFGKTEIFNQFC